jgi:SPP1 family predicted phage head-tail adaptor
MIDPGKLNTRIAIERDTLTYTSGAETRTPATVIETWAAMQVLSGSEAWKAQAVTPGVSVRFLLRYRTDILASDRVLVRSKRYEIKAVLPDEAKRESLTLECASLG